MVVDNKLVFKDQTNTSRPNNQPISTDPWLVGINCHIIIDGIGYIVANTGDPTQESQKAMGAEQTAPFFGDPVNMIDPQSSDMTMLLPIGQNDFTSGIGSSKLESDPKGYESGNNLQLTPQNTLYNGPLIVNQPFNTGPPTDLTRWWQEGYFDGTIINGAASEYFAIGGYLYNYNGTQWFGIPCRYPVTDLFGYGGMMLVCYGDQAGDLILPGGAASPINYLAYKGFRVNGSPFITYKDGRIYAAYLDPPAPPVIDSETGPDASYDSWEYCVNYVIVLGDGTHINTGIGSAALVDKAANKELTITLPGIPWKGGAVQRQLYRSKTNDPTTLYLIADIAALGALRTLWVDNALDTALTGPWAWGTQNNTAMLLLRGGDVAHNMWRADTHPIWLPEYNGVPNTGDRVWKSETFRDTSGNEALIIGTTSGLFEWDGVSNITQSLRPINYDYFNCISMAVNHGLVYFTTSRSLVHAWAPQQESFINGPWQIQFNDIEDIRLVSAGEFVFMAATGHDKYDGQYQTRIYRYNGTIFDWQTIIGGSVNYPILGKSIAAHDFLWYPNNATANIERVTMDPKYQNAQTAGVMFRSAMSDCGLPRLRKQVFAVMIRYLRLTPQVSTTLTTDAEPGDTFINVAAPGNFAVGQWIAIDDNFPNYQEYRQITSIVGGQLHLSHPLTNGALVNPHVAGIGVWVSGAVVTLRNIFTEDNPTPRDIQIGGPFRSDYLFSYIHLPVPVYSFLDGILIDWSTGTLMELVGWSMLTALNPPYYGLLDLNLRVQDQVKLPNNLFSPLSANDTINGLRAAYNKGAVDVIDQFNNARKMRVQRMSVDYEEPKQRHRSQYENQATAHIRLLDQDSELFKQENLVLGIPQSQ